MTEEFLKRMKEAKQEALESYEERLEEKCSDLDGYFISICELVLEAISSYDYDLDSYEQYLNPDTSNLGKPYSIRISNNCSSIPGRRLKANQTCMVLNFSNGELNVKDEDLEILNGVLNNNDIEVMKIKDSSQHTNLIISFNDSILDMTPEEKEKVKKKVYKRYAEEEL